MMFKGNDPDSSLNNLKVDPKIRTSENGKKITEFFDVSNNLNVMSKTSKLLRIVDNISQAVFITDMNAQIKWINPSVIRITGYSVDELIGSNMRILKSDHQDKQFYENMWKALNQIGQWQGEIWNRRKDGVVYLQWMSIFATYDEQNNPNEFIALCTDLSEKENFLAEINRSSFYDHLTGLPNRALLKKQIHEVADHPVDLNAKHYFVVLNVDRFSLINMSYGYTVGDQLLVEIGKRISSKLRDNDNVFRFSGDLFILLLREVTDVDTLVTILNRINDVLNEPFIIQNKKVNVTASYGISLYPDDGRNYDKLLQNAEIALNMAKEAGKNNIRFFSQSMNEKVTRWFKLGNELQNAIINNDLRVFYQIQVENRTGTIKGAEALVRWQHETLGILAPGDFVPYAEISGLIVPLGYWVIEHTFILIRDFKNRKIPRIKYSINLSSKQIVEVDLVENILQLAERYEIDPSQVEFEITESGAMENSKLTIDVFQRLKEKGFTLAIDDFGTGYSSLSYLANLPVDVIKIDRSFISNIAKNENQRRLTTAILSMAQTIGMKTVAEGVETIEEVEFLLDKQCDLLQGYYYSRPINAKAFEELLIKHDSSR